MALTDYTLDALPRFPVGSTVGAYRKSVLQGDALRQSSAPGGAADETAVVLADGTVSFTALEWDTDYYAGASVGGVWLYTGFRTEARTTIAGPVAFEGAIEFEDAVTFDQGVHYVSGVAAQTASGTPQYTHPIGSDAFRVTPEGAVLFGENLLIKNGDAGDAPITDWYFAGSVFDGIIDPVSMRAGFRSLRLAELGDPGDLVMARFGPNDSYPYHTGDPDDLTGILLGDPIFALRWMPAVTPYGGTPGVTGGASLQATAATINVKMAENPVESAPNTFHVGAHMIFSTCPVGAGAPVDRMRITSEGDVLIGRDTLYTSDLAADVGKLHLTGEVRSNSRVTARQGQASQTAIGAVGPGSEAGLAMRAGGGGAVGAVKVYAIDANTIGTTHKLSVLVGVDGELTFGDLGGGGNAGIQFGRTAGSHFTISNSGGNLSLSSGLLVTGSLGFFGAAAQTKKAVAGSRGGNAALADLLTQLAAYGLITDNTVV